MRKQDKRKNIEQANLMLEQSYLKSKSFLKENSDNILKALKSTWETNHMHKQDFFTKKKCKGNTWTPIRYQWCIFPLFT
jgi:hypothetical protein